MVEDLVAQPLHRRRYDGGLARVPDADGGHVRQAEHFWRHHCTKRWTTTSHHDQSLGHRIPCKVKDKQQSKALKVTPAKSYQELETD